MRLKQFFEQVRSHVDMITPGSVQVTLGQPPTYGDGQPIKPYVVVWPTPGTAIDEQTVSGRMGREATQISFQVTCVAPDPLNAMLVADDVNAALQDVVIGSAVVHPDVIANREARPLSDDTVRPVRYYTVTTWQTQFIRSTTNV